MKLKLELFLAGLVIGRCALHLVCAVKTGRVKLHWAGIVREFTPEPEPDNWDGNAARIFRNVK